MIFDWNKNQIWQAFFDFWKAKLWKKILRRKFLTLRRLGVNISCIDDSSFLKCTFRIRYQRSLKFLMKLWNWSFLVREISKKKWKIFFWTGSWIVLVHKFLNNESWPYIICRKWQVLINEVRKVDTLSLGTSKRAFFDMNLTLFWSKAWNWQVDHGQNDINP